jgi:hypothetical protein
MSSQGRVSVVRALVFTFVLLVVTGAYLTVYFSAPPEGSEGEPHMNVKVDPPKGVLTETSETGETGGKAQGSLSMEAMPKPRPQANVLPSAVTAIPNLSGAAATGSAAGDLMGGGVTVTVPPDAGE